jgi:signal transduction histidine kinase
VLDTGIGIGEDYPEAIFESFRQLDAERSEGLGLGLAIVRNMSELLGIKVAVVSTLGKGSRFSVTVPSAGTQ